MAWLACSRVRAPSTLGTFLRSFTPGNIHQVDAVGARLLARADRAGPTLLAGEPDGIAFIDIDDTMREVHGYAKQAAAYGYSGVRGLNIQLAALSTPIAAPVIGAARLRRGQHRSARGVGRLLSPDGARARAAGVSAG